MRLKPTPTRRGPRPERDAPIGLARNTALASALAMLGSTTLPDNYAHKARGGEELIMIKREEEEEA